MNNLFIDWPSINPILAALLSIGLNIAIAITGILPSAFITVGTVGIFGLNIGLIILIVGEAAGAIVSFILYRKGLHKITSYSKFNNIDNKFLQILKNNNGIDAFLMVILLRILPFVPSGIVTLTAAFSKMSLLSFSFASTFGKIPALFFEAYSVAYVLELETEWQLGIITFVGIILLIYLLRKRLKS
ncbi:TVP38/TMEM64 family protein [Niallia oryzisoli]|uniref:TVP38/TMEM64 family protein n=1 Tax=Niallia oryzisoli TaxID=1737571 RepID=UPI003736400F